MGAFLIFASGSCSVSLVSGADWTVQRANLAGTGATDEELPDQLDLLWDYDLGGLGFEGCPIVVGKTLYAAHYDGFVVALNTETGEQLWQVKFEDGFMAPPAYRDGRLIVGDDLGLIRTLDATYGKEVWQFDSRGLIYAGANFYGDWVLATSSIGSLFALKFDSGEQVWSYSIDQELRCGPTVAGEYTFLGGCDSFLHTLNVKTGKPHRDPIPIYSETGSTPAVEDGLVYLPTHGGSIYAFKVGEEKPVWEYRNKKFATEFENSVAVKDGIVVATSRNLRSRRVFAIDAKTGEEKWDHVLPKPSNASPIIAGSNVIVATADGRIVRLELSSGKQLWTTEVKHGFIGSPTVAAGKLFVANDHGTIFCFGKKN